MQGWRVRAEKNKFWEEQKDFLGKFPSEKLVEKMVLSAAKRNQLSYDGNEGG
jgi:hypothetical protein